jgi:hypothetical protein
MSACALPLASRWRASCGWCGVRAAGRPNFTPLAFARFLPSPVRARISSRSNSAKPPSTVSISLPCGVVVSAQVSLRLRKPAPRSLIVANTLSRSRVERASRSSLVTTSTSPTTSKMGGFREARRNKVDLFDRATIFSSLAGKFLYWWVYISSWRPAYRDSTAVQRCDQAPDQHAVEGGCPPPGPDRHFSLESRWSFLRLSLMPCPLLRSA